MINFTSLGALIDTVVVAVAVPPGPSHVSVYSVLNKVKDKVEAEKIKENSGKRAAAEISTKAYDSIATARIAASKLKADMDEADKIAPEDPKVKAEFFDVATLRAKGELEAAKLEQQALTNELLTSILQTLTQGQPISTKEAREAHSLQSVYDYMQGKGINKRG